MITNKFTAYGLTVAVAFAAAVVLLFASAPTSASADAGTSSDASVTITGIAPTNVVTLNGTHISGKEVCDEGTFAVSSPVGGTTGAITPAACSTITTLTNNASALATDTTITVDSTVGFPTSGSLIIDDDGNGDLSTGGALIEVVDYTGVTATSFTGVTRGRAGTTAQATSDNANVWPATYTQVTINPLVATDTNVNLVDASNLVAGGTTGADLVFSPGTGGSEVLDVLSISGNTLTMNAPGLAGGHAVGNYVAQISGVNTDSATLPFTPTDSTITEGSFKYTLAANGQTSTAGTISLTINSGLPDATDAEVAVSATLPTAIPVIVALVGTDTAEQFNNQAFTLTALPTQGVLGAVTTPICSNATAPAAGEVVSTCTAQVVYTPLVGATGTDSFTYTYTNGATPDTSAAGTITIILPGGTPTPTPGAGFGTAIVAGVNLTTYGGGTLVQLATDAGAAGATSVSVTSGGGFVVHVVGAPDFVNAAFAALFPTGVPAGTVVLVFAAS